MPATTADYLLTDVKYALKQLTRYGNIGRAVDALERVEAALEATVLETAVMESDTLDGDGMAKTPAPCRP